jgi:hypothetical protein
MSIEQQDKPGEEDWRDQDEMPDDVDPTDDEDTETVDEDHAAFYVDTVRENFPTDPDIDTDQDLTRVERANDD